MAHDAVAAELLSAGAPGFRPPMLATLVDGPVTGEGWVLERKLDGYRLIAVRDAGAVTLWTRNRQDRTAAFPELADALADQPAERFVLDGEVVAFAAGRPNFSRLQQRAGISDPRLARASGIDVELFLFDLLHLDGVDLDRLPLVARQRLLDEAFHLEAPLRRSPPLRGDPGTLLDEACRDGWEGLIAKRADAPYRPGRSRDWLKLKCLARQELVIGGWTDPKGARSGLGSLLVGYHDDDDGALVFAGKVGTGFDEATLRDLGRRLEPLSTPRCPFDRDRPTGRGLHWVEPVLVAEVGFSEWTGTGRLRHPRFLGLRSDKDPAEVVRERPGATP
jgi:bifunctional non-homologous end joining protein LigD